jgi:hypothetical protein
MHAAPKSDYPVADPAVLEKYDAFLFGIPTRYGNFPAQWKTFWDSAGKQWLSGAYWGKYAGVFVSTGTPGGGQESTIIAAMSTLAHHGIIYVPLGYKTAFPLLSNLSELRGGSPWGAGTFAVSPPISFLVGTYLMSHRQRMDPVSQLLWSSSLPLFTGSLLPRPSRKSALTRCPGLAADKARINVDKDVRLKAIGLNNPNQRIRWRWVWKPEMKTIQLLPYFPIL